MEWGRLLFGFNGRANRTRYWLASAIYFVIGLILTGLGYFLSDNLVFQVVGSIIDLVVLVSLFIVARKRLHDRNKSGWYLVLFYITPGVLIAAGALISLTDNETASMIGNVLWLIAGAIGLWTFVEMGCLRGSIGANQYGPDPIAAG